MKQITNKASRASWSLGLLLVFCLIFVPIFLQAGELGEHEVRVAVETWVRHVTADARPDAVIERMEPHQVKGEMVAYVAHLLGGGFCLCGADDLVLPVYFYSPQGTYGPQNPNYQYILWEIETRLKCLREGLEKGDSKVLQYQEVLAERASFWQDLIAGRSPTRMEDKYDRVEPVMMELDLTCQWSQGSPYNDQCPELTPFADEHTVVGCVATAMSQIMYYWQWPNTGQSTDSVDYNYRWRGNWDEEPLVDDPGIPGGWGGRLEWTAADGGKLRMNGYWDGSRYGGAQNINDDPDYLNALQTLWDNLTLASTNCVANFGATTYNWSIIEDTHTDPSDTGDAEVAKLCYHAGIAVGMGYGVWGSGASTSNVEDALEDHFRYDYDATYGARNINTMTEEIQWLRSLELRGTRHDTLGGGGHAWVVFGYNKATDPEQFKMNLGWGGGCDGWYSCDNIPCAPFVLGQAHVTRIAPKDVVGFVGAANLGDGSPGDPYQDVEEAIDEAPDNATLIFKAGSDNTFSIDTLTIDRPFTLKGKDVTIRKE